MNLREQAQQLAPTIRIGKKGLTDEQIFELKNQLKTRKLVKVKLLQAFLEDHDRKQVVKDLAKLTGSEVVYAVGFVAVFHKK